MNTTYYIEQYRHKNDDELTARYSDCIYRSTLESFFATSKKTNHITVCYFIVKLKPKNND